MRIVVGLGNPGDEYEGTRHNVGFSVLDETAKLTRVSFTMRGGIAAVADGRKAAKPFLLVKPLTYMNRSGEPLRVVMRDMGGRVEDVLVVLDEFNLELGSLRVRASGSDGGHNGLKSVIACLGTNEVARLRVGIGPAPEHMPKDVFVLRRFERSEAKAVQQTVESAAWAVEDWIRGARIEDLANRYNRRL